MNKVCSCVIYYPDQFLCPNSNPKSNLCSSCLNSSYLLKSYWMNHQFKNCLYAACSYVSFARWKLVWLVIPLTQRCVSLVSRYACWKFVPSWHGMCYSTCLVTVRASEHFLVIEFLPIFLRVDCFRHI